MYIYSVLKLKMQTLKARCEEIDITETYKILNGVNNVDWRTWFTKNTTVDSGRETRAAADPHSLRMPPARLDLRRNFFSHRVVERWNNLPSAVKDSKNVKQFKMAYRRHIDVAST